MKRLLESNRFRRLIAPTVTRLRRHPEILSLIRTTRQSLGLKGEVWKTGSDKVEEEYRVNFRSMLPAGFSGSVGLIASTQDPIIPYFWKSLDILGISGQIYDPILSSFHDEILMSSCDLFICRPMHFTNLQRQMFWEKVLPLYDVPDINIFPSKLELRIYEAKRELAYFLKCNQIPHPDTHVFYDIDDALEFAQGCTLPQVFKTNTGASSVGVEIVRRRSDLISLLRQAFKSHYLKKSIADYRDIDYGYVILQEYVTDPREYRIIKIGDSWFGHEKRPGPDSELMSGSGVNSWEVPPVELFDLCADLARRFGFLNMCFDLFRSRDGPWLVNELQTWFGSYNNSQMYRNSVPGRFIFQQSRWRFEVGFFNQYRSLPLIVASCLRSGKTN